MNQNLPAKLKTLPSAPGVYFHKNSSGEIIYVGKAAVLKNRVRSYFRHDKDRDPKTAALVKEIFDTDWIVVDTEMDALFLESEMIKRYMPKWNILLRDDKTVSYIRISMQEKVPDLTFTRIPLDDGATYVGPFYGKTAIEKSLRVLRKIFPYYIKPYTGKHTLDSDLGLSPGIESGKTTPRKYKNNLKKLIRVLEGDREKLIVDLEREMLKESDAGNFEAAAELRNEIFGLKELRKKIIFSDKEFLDISSDRALKQLQTLLGLEKPPRRIEGYDISHQSGTNVVASMVVFLNGAPARDQYRKFKLRNQRNDDPKNLLEVLTRRFNHLDEWEKPDLIILDGGELQLKAVLSLLNQHQIPFLATEKSGDHSKTLHSHRILYGSGPSYAALTVRDSDYAKLITRIDDEAHRFAITYHTYLKRKNLFS